MFRIAEYATKYARAFESNIVLFDFCNHTFTKS